MKNWFKCSDHLPEDEKDVLLCSIAGKLGVFKRDSLYLSVDRYMQCDGDDRKKFNCQRFYDSIPLCWMELPPFPKKCPECEEYLFKGNDGFIYCKYCTTF